MGSVRRSGIDRNAATWTEGASLLRIRWAEEREASEERIGHGPDDGTARSTSVNLAREGRRGEQHTDTRCTNGTSEPDGVGRDRSLQSGDLRGDQTGSGVHVGRDIRRTGRSGAFEGVSGATGGKRETTTNLPSVNYIPIYEIGRRGERDVGSEGLGRPRPNERTDNRREPRRRVSGVRVRRGRSLRVTGRTSQRPEPRRSEPRRLLFATANVRV